MEYTPLTAGTLVTETQRLIINSALALTGQTQGDFAEAHDGINRADLNRVLVGRLVLSERYVGVLNDLVTSVHPVQLAA